MTATIRNTYRGREAAPARKASIRECLTCGLFVYWQFVDGFDRTVELNPGTRQQVVTAVLENGEIFRINRYSEDVVSFIVEDRADLARHLALGGALEQWPTLHLGHIHKRAGGRYVRHRFHKLDSPEEPPF